MRIIVEKINDKLSYPYKNMKIINNCIEFNTFDDLNIIFENSFNQIKSIHGFEKMLIQHENRKVNNYQYFVDHSNYANLFLTFENDNNILEYVQDMCEARGEKIPKNLDSAFDYLINENTYVMKIKEFEINLDEFRKHFKK